MANPGNIEQHKWPKGISGNPNGRPRKLVNSLLKEIKEAGIPRVTAGMVAETIESLLNLTRQDLVNIYMDQEQPVILRIIARELQMRDAFNAVEILLSRAQGRPMTKQSIDISSVQIDHSVDLTKLSADELRTVISILEKTQPNE